MRLTVADHAEYRWSPPCGFRERTLKLYDTPGIISVISAAAMVTVVVAPPLLEDVSVS